MDRARQHQTPREILQPVLHDRLAFMPGEKSSYSNSGYFLLGLVIEKVTGKSLGEYLKMEIFNPLEMKNTYLEDHSSLSSWKVRGYSHRAESLQAETLLDPLQYWAAGGIVTTLQDMIRWDEALTNGTMLSIEDVRRMMLPAKLNDGSTGEYGLGFELMNTPEMRIAGHNGVGVGFNASYMRFLNDGITVIVLTNTTNSNSTMIAKNVHDLLKGSAENHPMSSEDQSKKDDLDSLVARVVRHTEASDIREEDFEDKDSMNKFKDDALVYIKEQGKVLSINRQGERVNPQSIARKYEIKFERGATSWVFIFSNQRKIVMANHR